MKFFKFYYDKLTVEHPRWSANQISTIIKLLWKKKLTTDKAASRSPLRIRTHRRVSGRLAFRKAHGYNGIEAAERWRQLPLESKRYWKLIGLGFTPGDKKGIPSSINFKKGPPRKGSDSSINTNAAKSLSFMKKTIL